jgi:sugar phosphate isomerase/epimerase
MKIAIFNQHITDAAKQSGFSRIEILKQLRKKGVTGLEYGIQELEDVEVTKKELIEAEMEIISIYQLCHYESNLKADTKIVDVAARLGVDKLLIIPGFFQEDQSDAEVLASCKKAMNELTAYAKSKSIQITIEDFDASNSVILDSEMMRWFGENVTHLTYTFDTGNFIYSGEDELVAFEQLKDKIVHVHAKDRGAKMIPQADVTVTTSGHQLYTVATGQGIIKISEVIERLKALDYQGYVTIEHFGADDYLQTMLDSVDWLNQKIK